MYYGTNPGHFETSIINFPTSEGVSEVSGASERANGRARGPVLTSLFLFVPDHSATMSRPRRHMINPTNLHFTRGANMGVPVAWRRCESDPKDPMKGAWSDADVENCISHGVKGNRGGLNDQYGEKSIFLA